MNYGNLRYNKIKVWFFEKCWFWGNELVYVGCVLYYELLFLIRLSDSVSFSVYMKIFSRYVLANVTF